jgi:hypothetical protein
MSILSNSSNSFNIFRRALAQDGSVPLNEIIQSDLFEAPLESAGVCFGQEPDAVYTPALALWCLVSQFLYEGTQRSCDAAATRAASIWESIAGRIVGISGAGYCRAKAKLPSEAIRTISCRLADRTEVALQTFENLSIPLDKELAEERLAPRGIAELRKQSIKGRILMVDGFTVDAADTPSNQEIYPQNPRQAEGLGFPLIRCVAITSLTTGLLVDLEIAPYCGKETGETALMRKLSDHLRVGDTLLADCYHCSYWMVANCKKRQVDLVMKNHHLRDDHPFQCVELNEHERLVTWPLPPRPEWMPLEDYQEMPAELTVRLSDIVVEQANFRTEGYTVATTFLDPETHSRHWLGEVYRSRWYVELDIKSLKVTLGLEHLRSRNPAEVLLELWAGLLMYNLIRFKMLQSSIVNNRDCRSMSFSQTHQVLATNWLLWSTRATRRSTVSLCLSMLANRVVGNRPDRVEPRANKRRPKVLALMTQSRQFFQDLLKARAS